MTPGQTPYADGQFVGDSIDRPPQADPIELHLSKGAAAMREEALAAARREIDQRSEPCPGAGMVAMLDPHPDMPGKLLVRCPICGAIVPPAWSIGSAPAVPEHREVARG